MAISTAVSILRKKMWENLLRFDIHCKTHVVLVKQNWENCEILRQARNTGTK